MCKFFHIRNLDDVDTGEVATKGGKTVAFDVVDNQLRFAVAECSKRDNFCRRIGRTIAEGRLKKNHNVVTIPLSPENDEQDKAAFQILLQTLGVA